MAYLFTVNQTHGSFSAWGYTLKELLKTQSWTVESSGDGLAAYSASGDVITHGGGGANGMANNRAWFRIKQPTGGIAPFAGAQEFVFQRVNGDTGTGRDWRLKWGPRLSGAPFTGGSPSANTVPGSTFEHVFHGSGSDASPYGPSYFNSSENTARTQYGAGDMTTDRATFWTATYPIGGGDPTSFLLLDCLLFGSFPYGTPGSQDDNPYMLFGQRRTATEGDFVAESTGWVGFIKYGLVGESFRYMPACRYHTGGGTAIPEQLGANSHNLKDDILPQMIAIRAGLGAPNGWKGIIHMVKWNGTNRATADTLTVNTTSDRIVMDTCNLPWNGGVPLV